MGGVLIIISIVMPTLLWADLRYPYVWIAIARAAGLRLDRLPRRLRQDHASSAISGSAGRRKLLYQFSMGFVLRRGAAVHARLRRFLHRR